MVGMLHELLEPSVCDGNALTFGVFVTNFEAFIGGLLDDVLHVLLPQSAQYTKEELLQSILIEVFHRELLIGRDVETDDLVLFEMQLLVGEDVSHEAKLGSLHRRQEHVHYIHVRMRW